MLLGKLAHPAQQELLEHLVPKDLLEVLARQEPPEPRVLQGQLVHLEQLVLAARLAQRVHLVNLGLKVLVEPQEFLALLVELEALECKEQEEPQVLLGQVDPADNQDHLVQ